MFSVKRVKNLIVKDLVSSSKIVLAMTVGLIFLQLLQLVVPYLRYSSYSHLDVVWRSGLFNVSALWVVTVGIIPFTEYSKKYNRASAILLPATQEEKFAANFIMTFVILPIMLLLSVAIGVGLSWVVNTFRFESYSFSLSSDYFTNIDNWLSSLFFVSIFFFGSIFFKKNRLIRTIAGFAIYGFLLLAIVITIMYFKQQSGEMKDPTNNIDIFTVSSRIYCICSALFFIVLSYFRLREVRS